MNKFGTTCLVLVLIAAFVAIKVGKSDSAGRADSIPNVSAGDARTSIAVGNEVDCSSCNPNDPAPVEEQSNNTPLVIALDDIPASKLKTGLLVLNPEELKEALNTLSSMNFQTNDVDSVGVSPGGAIYFICTFTNADGAEQGGGIVLAADEEALELLPLAEGVSVPISQPPIRHSRPGSSKVLFLDFNGHVIENTLWNSDADYGSVASWDCMAWSIDGDRTTFSTSEQERIIEIWERVAEDYAPFDVDVTTEQPTTWTTTTGHALITPTTDSNGVNCPHYGYGGIAYVGVFGNSTYSYNSSNARSPAWCIDYTGASCAEVISHELGHNMGLSHDGTSSSGYYPGHVNGGIKWGPIMGTGYSDDVSQWCKGEYYDANQTQDDLVIIKNRVGIRPDDHGDNNASASALTILGSGAVSDSGIIEATGDPDVFSFLTGAGTIVIEASAYKASSSTWGANLDILLELYDSTGTLVANNNPALDVDASITASVSAGSYYLHVKPTGAGNPLNSSPTGYAVYGSLGQYWLTGMVSADADSDGMPNEWEVLYFGGFTNAIASADNDGDGSENLTEYVAGTLPNSAASVFEVTSFQPSVTGGAPHIIHWSPVVGRTYGVEWTGNLLYTPFINISGDLPYPANSYTDTVERAGTVHYYRVDVKLQ